MGIVNKAEPKVPYTCVSFFERTEKKQISASSFSYSNISAKVNKIDPKIKLSLDKELIRKSSLSIQQKDAIRLFVEQELMQRIKDIPYQNLSFEILSFDSLALSLLISKDSVIKIFINSFDKNDENVIFTYFHYNDLLMNGLGTIQNVFLELMELFPQPSNLSLETISAQKSI